MNIYNFIRVANALPVYKLEIYGRQDRKGEKKAGKVRRRLEMEGGVEGWPPATTI